MKRRREEKKMTLVTSKQLMLDAQKGGYAIGAFNVENMEMVQAVIAAAEEKNSPVILQTTPGTVKYAGLSMYYANVEACARTAKVPVVIHLDHGSSFELAMQAYRAGYTSIMIDGSKLPFEENIALSKAVADACHPGGIPVEAELGKVGGKEDDLQNADDSPYTDPKEAAEFVERTGVDTLAIAVGTAHGVYKKTPKLDVERITAVRQLVSIPLVLHGTSGVPDEQVRECVRRGMCKVNYATDLRIAFTNGVKKYMAENPDAFDPKKYSAAGREEVKKYVMQKMEVVGSAGKAAQYYTPLETLIF
jgi:tagatose 1,6-diphosphate aldolase GatY/KbaY